jgi:hypothetical protein
VNMPDLAALLIDQFHCPQEWFYSFRVFLGNFGWKWGRPIALWVM